jgi:hypothetical protein
MREIDNNTTGKTSSHCLISNELKLKYIKFNKSEC